MDSTVLLILGLYILKGVPFIHCDLNQQSSPINIYQMHQEIPQFQNNNPTYGTMNTDQSYNFNNQQPQRPHGFFRNDEVQGTWMSQGRSPEFPSISTVTGTNTTPQPPPQLPLYHVLKPEMGFAVTKSDSDGKLFTLDPIDEHKGADKVVLQASTSRGDQRVEDRNINHSSSVGNSNNHHQSPYQQSIIKPDGVIKNGYNAEARQYPHGRFTGSSSHRFTRSDAIIPIQIMHF